MDEKTVQRLTAALLRELVSEDEHKSPHLDLEKTPRRVAVAWKEFMSGYADELGGDSNAFTVFERSSIGHGQMVVVSNVDFSSMCAHHLLPFRGKASVGYLPRDLEVGISKIPRLITMYARRLQTQEALGDQIADFMADKLLPRGVGVLIRAEHLCVACRGVNKSDVVTTTSSLRGLFMTDYSVRAEFLGILGIR